MAFLRSEPAHHYANHLQDKRSFALILCSNTAVDTDWTNLHFGRERLAKRYAGFSAVSSGDYFALTKCQAVKSFMDYVISFSL